MNWLRAGATRPVAGDAVTPQTRLMATATRLVVTNDRRGLRCSFLRACGLALLPGATHNTYCAFVPLVPRFTPLFFSRRHSSLVSRFSAE